MVRTDTPRPTDVSGPTPAAERRHARVRLGGAHVDCLSVDAAVDSVIALAAAARSRSLITTPNIQHIALLESDVALRQAYDHAALVFADGAPVAAACRLAGVPGAERVTGSDLLPAVCAAAAKCGLTVGLVGGRPGAARLARRRLHQDFPDLRVVLVLDPPHGEAFVAVEEEVAATVRRADPDILFLGLGTPKQEVFADRHDLGHGAVLCCGAAIDYYARVVQRAPRLMQSLGLEWLFRLLSEPQRLLKRYLRAAPAFLRVCLRDVPRRQVTRTSTDVSNAPIAGAVRVPPQAQREAFDLVRD